MSIDLPLLRAGYNLSFNFYERNYDFIQLNYDRKKNNMYHVSLISFALWRLHKIQIYPFHNLPWLSPLVFTNFFAALRSSMKAEVYIKYLYQGGFFEKKLS